MTSIGGYFASLDLVTNASSFDRARRYFSGLSSEADKASSAVNRLQEQISKNASSFFKGGGSSQPSKPNSYDQFKGYKMNPESGYMVDETEKEDQKRNQRKDYLTKIASLYVMMKLLTMLKDVAVKLANLTYAMTQANMKAYTGAIQANMSPNVMKAWKMAAEMNGQDSSDMLSRFSAFNRAFVELGLGRGEAYGGIAQSMSLLSKTSGVNLDPQKMIGLTNDQRISEIFNALRVAYGKNAQLSMQLADDLLGPGMKGILAGDMTTGTNSFARAQGAIQASLSSKDVQVGQEFGLMKQGVNEMLALLGQTLGAQFLDEVQKFNEWLRTHKAEIKAVMDTVAVVLQTLFDAIAFAIEFMVEVFDKIDQWFSKVNAELNKWLPVFGAVPGDPSNGSAWSGITGQAIRAQADAFLASEYGIVTPQGATFNMTFNGVTGDPAQFRQISEEAYSRAMDTAANGRYAK